MSELHSLGSIVGRLERLERQNRVLRAFLGVVLVAFVTAASIAGKSDVPEPGVIDARQFRVVDAQGRVRAVLGAFAETPGSPVSLTLYDSNSNECLNLTTEGTQDAQMVSSLTFKTPEGAQRLRLYAGGALNAGLQIEQPETWDPVAFERKAKVLTREQALEFLEQQLAKLGAPLFFAGYDSRVESPIVRFCDQGRRLRMVLGACELAVADSGIKEKRPPSSLVLFNELGKVTSEHP